MYTWVIPPMMYRGLLSGFGVRHIARMAYDFHSIGSLESGTELES